MWRIAAIVVGIVGLLALSVFFVATPPPSKEPLRLLAWVGYDEPEFLDPLKRKLGRNIVVDTYVGGDRMYTMLTQAPPGTYDVVVVDAEFGEKLFRERKLSKLDSTEWRFPDSLSPFKDGDPARLGVNQFGVPARWGALGLVINTERVGNKCASYHCLLDPSLRGKVGIFDWYLPNMGVFSIAKGNRSPFQLSAVQLLGVTELLDEIRPQVASIQPDTGPVIEDLRAGRVWAVPGIGEWAAALLRAEGRPIDWIVPKEGGAMWIEALAIPTSAPDRAASTSFIKAVMAPEILAKLANRKAYYSQLTREEAYSFVPPQVRAALKAEDVDRLDREIASRLVFRRLPTGPMGEQEWLRAWMRFKSGS
jgi:spermidine/putrescine transport system substrate-binding protein